MVGPLGEVDSLVGRDPNDGYDTTPNWLSQHARQYSSTLFFNTDLNLHGFSTDYLIFLIFLVVLGALGWCCWRFEGQPLSSMRYKYEQITHACKKKRMSQSVFIYIIFDLATNNTFPWNRAR